MRVFEVREHYGNCLELVSMDPNFHNVTVGLFIKNEESVEMYVWENSYSRQASIQ